METNAALIGPKRRVKLHTETAIDLNLIVIINPRHAENDLALGLANPFDEGFIGVFGLSGDHATKAFKNLARGLMEFRLPRVAVQHGAEDRLKFFVDCIHCAVSLS